MRKILIPILAVFAICTFFAVANAQVTQTPAFNYDLRLGSSGAEVANLQTWLIQNRFSIPAITSGAALKGYFGIQTRNAVTAFQNSVGLPAVGYFDAQTRAFINKNYTQQTPPGTLKVTSPNGNETWQKGTTQKISWTLSAPIYGVGTIRLLPYVPPCAEPTAPVRCLIAVHAPYIVASDASLQNGYYLWTVANAVETGSPLSSFANIPDGQYKIQVCSANDTFCDTSDNYFNITSNSGGGTGPLQVTSPNGGEYWKTDTIEQIRWTSPQYFRAAYVDIKLIRTMPPCTGICPMYAFAPYRIATGVSANQNSYSWSVGQTYTGGAYSGPNLVTVPDGQYTIQICEQGTSVCDSSNSSFNIYSGSNPGSQAPVINGVDAPTSLNVNQSGTWTVRASDPQNGNLNYSVDWGDNYYPQNGYTATPMQNQYVQTATFTHSYANPGTYTVKFTVRNNAGLTTQSSATVYVTGNSYYQPTVKVISPNGGEVWAQGSVHQLLWNVNGNNVGSNTKLDLFLGREFNPQSDCLAGYTCDPLYYNFYPQYVLDRNIGADTVYNWIVGTDINNAIIPTGSYKVLVCISGSTSACDRSDYNFMISPNYDSSITPLLCPIGYTCTKIQ